MGLSNFWIKVGVVLVLELIWAGCMIVLGAHFPTFFVATIVLWVIAFTWGKSTKVRVSLDPYEPKVRLSYKEFDRWTELRHLRNESTWHGVLLGVPPHMLEQMDFPWAVAYRHRRAFGLCIWLVGSADLILLDAVLTGDLHERLTRYPGDLFFLFVVGAFLVGLIAGHGSGTFYRWVRAKW